MGKYMRKCGRGIGAVAVMEVTTEAVGVRTRARALALAAAGGAPGGRDVAGRKRRKVDGAGGEFRVSYLQLRSRSLILTPAKNRKAAAGSAAADAAADAAVAAASEAPASSRCSEKGAVDGGCGASGGGGEWDRVSRCSSNASSEVVAPAEKASSGSGRSRATAEVDDCYETSACNYDAGLQRCRERTPSSEQRERESDDLESTARPGESGGGRRRNAASTAVAAASGRSAPLMPSAAEIEDFFAVAEKQEWQRFAQKYNYDVVKDVPLQGRYEWVQIKP